MKKKAVDNLEIIQKAQVANIVKKLKEGKVLTAREQAIVESQQSGKTIVAQKRICEIFSITRKTIAQWRREGKEGVPKKEHGGENLNAWREFFASNPDAGFFDGKPRADRETLLCEKLQVEIDIGKIKKSKLEGELISMNEVSDGMAAVSSVLRTSIGRLQADLPPVLEGMDAAAMSKRIAEATDALLAQIREMLTNLKDEWQSEDD